MERMLRDKKTILFFVGPALLLYVLIMLYPIVHAIYVSFFNWNIMGAATFNGVQNYVRMFTRDDLVIKTLRNTLVILAASLVGQMGFGFLFAYILSFGTRFKNLFKNFYFLPSVLSSAAVGAMWSFMYNPRGGLVNGFLRLIGLESLTRSWLTEESTALGAICVVVVWQFTGYTMTLFMAGIKGIPESVYESAKLDGANHFHLMTKITIPLMMPIIRVSTILITVGSLKFFDLVLVMTPGGGPNRVTEVLAHYMWRNAFTNHQLGYGTSLAVLMLVLCLVSTGIINRLFKNTTHEY